MSNNKFLADYAYLAEASYADFSDVVDLSDLQRKDSATIKAIAKDDSQKPFATLVTKNYEVMAHYKDRSPSYSLDNIATETHNTESGFSRTLFKGREGTENAGNYVIC